MKLIAAIALAPMLMLFALSTVFAQAETEAPALPDLEAPALPDLDFAQQYDLYLVPMLANMPPPEWLPQSEFSYLGQGQMGDVFVSQGREAAIALSRWFVDSSERVCWIEGDRTSHGGTYTRNGVTKICDCNMFNCGWMEVSNEPQEADEDN